MKFKLKNIKSLAFLILIILLLSASFWLVSLSAPEGTSDQSEDIGQETRPPFNFVPSASEPEQINVPTAENFDVQEYYVAQFGDDDNPGTEDRPWKTIQRAVEVLKEGEVAYVLEGEYDERIILNKSGIRLEGIGEVIVRGFEVRGDDNTIKNFVITDPSSEAGLWIKGNNNTLVENEIYHMKQDGIWFFGDGNTFKGNYIHDILAPSTRGDPHADCMQTWGPATNIVFEGNLCVHNRTSGSNQILMLESMNSPVNNITFINNIFVMDDPGYSPMNFHRKTGQSPIKNIFIVNNNFIHRIGIGQYGIRLVNIDDVVIQNNLFVDYGNGSNSYIRLENQGTGLTVGYNAVFKSDDIEPMGGPFENDIWMVDPGLQDYQNLNFNLVQGSPLIDKGVYIENLSLDFEGNKRPQGDGVDIGAIEFTNK